MIYKLRYFNLFTIKFQFNMLIKPRASPVPFVNIKVSKGGILYKKE